jgi:hypothetical protein
MSDRQSTIAVTNSDGTNGTIVRTITMPLNDHADYSWMLLGLLAVVLIASGLREVFRNKDSH